MAFTNPKIGITLKAMEPIIDYLKRKLKESGPKRWTAIAAAVSTQLPEGEKFSEHLLRKIAYGDRENPGVATIQPLLDYFGAVDRGELELPDLAADLAPTIPEPTAQGV